MMNKTVYLTLFIFLSIVFQTNLVNTQSLYRGKDLDDLLKREEYDFIKNDKNLIPYIIQNIESATDSIRIKDAFRWAALLEPKLKLDLIPFSKQYLNKLLFETNLTKNDNRIYCIYCIFQILTDSEYNENHDFVLQFLKSADQWQLGEKTIKYQSHLPKSDSKTINSAIRLYVFNCFASSSNDIQSIKKWNY